MIELLDINDFCLSKIFNYCDVESIITVSKVCTRFNIIASEFHFSKQTKLCYDLNNGFENFICIVNCIGQYLIELKISAGQEHIPLSFFEFLGRSIGDRIRKLSLVSFRKMDRSSLQAMSPILQRLEELEIDLKCPYFQFNKLELDLLCPNLRRLQMFGGTFYWFCNDRWPNLVKLSLENAYGGSSFLTFMEKNPQIQELEFRDENEYFPPTKLHEITLRLRQLERLVLTDMSANEIQELQQLQHLRRLTLRNMKRDNFENIISVVMELDELIELQIQNAESFEPKHQTVLEIARRMPNVQVFGISWCNLTDEIVLEFLRNARNLRQFHIHHCDFDDNLTQHKIGAIINAREQIPDVPAPLIMRIYKTTGKDYISNVNSPN